MVNRPQKTARDISIAVCFTPLGAATRSPHALRRSSNRPVSWLIHFVLRSTLHDRVCRRTHSGAMAPAAMRIAVATGKFSAPSNYQARPASAGLGGGRRNSLRASLKNRSTISTRLARQSVMPVQAKHAAVPEAQVRSPTQAIAISFSQLTTTIFSNVPRTGDTEWNRSQTALTDTGFLGKVKPAHT